MNLGAVHSRFGRNVLIIYLVAAAASVALLVGALATDRTHQEATARDTLLLGVETRSHFLGRELGLLGGELRRLGLRSEVDLLDQNMEPEQSLLRLSHERSAFFNVGVAIIGADGKVLWALPAGFLNVGASVLETDWFRAVQHSLDVRIVPVSPESPADSLVYIVSPIHRSDAFAGALVGAVDLAVGAELDPERGFGAGADVVTVLATRDGTVVYPPRPPDFAADPEWRRLFVDRADDPFLTAVTFGGRERVVAGDMVNASTGVQGSPDLVLLAVADADSLFAPARGRLLTRLIFAVTVALMPIALLVLVLRRTLRVFRGAQEEAARGERTRLVGEAANLIAHEVKNTLNGLSLGLDMLMRPPRPGEEGRPKTLAVLRSEMERLSSFTTKLLTFSKGIAPRVSPMDLADHVRKICELWADAASEQGIDLDVTVPESLPLRADSALVHVVVSNLVSNALDALAGARPPRTPWIKVLVARSGPNLVFVRVSDDGPGLSASVRAGLFEPFVTSKPSGVGIGLALSRKIARAHGGDLVLEDSLVGASFRFDLPLSKPAPMKSGDAQ